MFEAIIGFALLFMIFHVVRAVLGAFRAKTAPPRMPPKTPGQPPPGPSVATAAARRSPWDTTADTTARAASVSGPRDLLLKAALAAKAAREAKASPAARVVRPAQRSKVSAARPPQPSLAKSYAPFIIRHPRRFPWLGLLAIVAIIAMILAAVALLDDPAPEPPSAHAAIAAAVARAG